MIYVWLLCSLLEALCMLYAFKCLVNGKDPKLK